MSLQLLWQLGWTQGSHVGQTPSPLLSLATLVSCYHKAQVTH